MKLENDNLRFAFFNTLSCNPSGPPMMKQISLNWFWICCILAENLSEVKFLPLISNAATKAFNGILANILSPSFCFIISGFLFCVIGSSFISIKFIRAYGESRFVSSLSQTRVYLSFIFPTEMMVRRMIRDLFWILYLMVNFSLTITFLE